MTEQRRPETVSSGNALFAVFGAVALVGLLGASVNTFVRGPLTSAIKQTRTNAAKTQMQIAGQAAVMLSAGSVSSGEHAKVFYTSTSQQPNNLAGLAGADSICQTRANAAGLPGTYKAWLSDATNSPSTRFTKQTVPYKLVTGTTIANNWVDLIDGTLAAPINLDETGVGASSTHSAATNTNTNGTVFSSTNHCTSFSANSGTVQSGDKRNANATWTNSSTTTTCVQAMRLYCFQQDISYDTAANGDCDGDGVIEPVEWRAPGATPAPTGGGLIPTNIGINKKDPWGTEYGYCAWDYGSTSLSNACKQTTPGTNLRLAGHATNRDAPVVAIISAGPDKKFTTTCRSFATADVNSNGVLTDTNDLPLVGKASTSDDDIIFTYTYTQAMNATGGLWQLKSGAPSVATIAKNVEAQEARFSGAGLFAKLAAATGDFLDVVSGIRLGSPSVVATCNAANTNALRRNASDNGVEVCNGTAWTSAVGFGTGTGNAIGQDVPPVTENKVFVTSSTYTGNLGGLSGADAICQKHANAAGLPGKYMAWLADLSDSPRSRFHQSALPYKLVDGTVIANNWTDLIDGTLAATPNKTETGATSNVSVWTNVQSNGHMQSSSSACDGYWTSSVDDASIIGRIGTNGVTNAAWTQNNTSRCNIYRGLYCFQQTEGATWTDGGSTAGTFDSLSDGITDYANDLLYGGTGSGGTGNSSKVSWGYQNFTNSSSAYESTALGAQAGRVLNTSSNIALGYQALLNTTTGAQNTVMGSLAGAAMGSNDYYNTGAGYNVLSGSGGINNVYIGSESGKAGTDNVGFGASALKANTGNQNVALGYEAALVNDTGGGNTVAGAEALRANISGSNNVAIGYQSMRLNRTSENTAVGQRSLTTNVSGLRAVAIGSEASRYQLGDDNTSIGAVALKGVNNLSTGINNTATGYGALGGNTTGVDNTAIGYQALLVNTDGSYNAAAGYQTLRALTSGNNNTAIGSEALLSLATGSDNAAVGSQALKLQTTGSGNTAVGYNTGSRITTSSGHTIIGSQAQGNGIVTSPVTAIGHYALFDNTGTGNTGIGTYALIQLFNGSNNTAVGYAAGANGGSPTKNTNNMTVVGSNAANTARGDDLTAIGYAALSLASGASNTGMGYRVMTNLTTGAYNTALGDEAGANMTTASHNALAGYRAGYFNVTGDFVTAAGYQALYQNLAPANTALGYQALLGNSNGLYNTAIGYAALQANTVGNFNTAIGSEALNNLNGTYAAATCTGLGAAATVTDTATGHCYYRTSSLYNWADAQAACEANGDYLAVVSTETENNLILSIGSGNSWLGAKDDTVEGEWRWLNADLRNVQFWQGAVAGAKSNDLYTKWGAGEPNNSSGNQNCLISGVSASAWADTGCTSSYSGICEREPAYTSSYNTAVGKQALYNTTTGSRNTAIGFEALKGNTTGSDNTAIGYQALATNTTGSQNVAIGYQAGPNANNLSNTISIGNGAVTTASNSIRVGDNAITEISGQVAFSSPSDARLKKDIAPSDLGLDFIMGLKPVSYRLKRGNGRLDYGFLAQDIEEKLDGRITNMITRRNDEMKTYQLRASDLIAPLVKALQEQDEIIKRLEGKIKAVKAARACTKQNAEGRE